MVSTAMHAAPTWVYRVYDEADRLLYIGFTGDLKARFRDHKKWAKWYQFAARRVLRGPYERPVAYEVEQQLIATLRPRFNTNVAKGLDWDWWAGANDRYATYLRERGDRPVLLSNVLDEIERRKSPHSGHWRYRKAEVAA